MAVSTGGPLVMQGQVTQSAPQPYTVAQPTAVSVLVVWRQKQLLCGSYTCVDAQECCACQDYKLNLVSVSLSGSETGVHHFPFLYLQENAKCPPRTMFCFQFQKVSLLFDLRSWVLIKIFVQSQILFQRFSQSLSFTARLLFLLSNLLALLLCLLFSALLHRLLLLFPWFYEHCQDLVLFCLPHCTAKSLSLLRHQQKLETCVFLYKTSTLKIVFLRCPLCSLGLPWIDLSSFF